MSEREAKPCPLDHQHDQHNAVLYQKYKMDRSYRGDPPQNGPTTRKATSSTAREQRPIHDVARVQADINNDEYGFESLMNENDCEERRRLQAMDEAHRPCRSILLLLLLVLTTAWWFGQSFEEEEKATTLVDHTRMRGVRRNEKRQHRKQHRLSVSLLNHEADHDMKIHEEEEPS